MINISSHVVVITELEVLEELAVITQMLSGVVEVIVDVDVVTN